MKRKIKRLIRKAFNLLRGVVIKKANSSCCGVKRQLAASIIKLQSLHGHRFHGIQGHVLGLNILELFRRFWSCSSSHFRSTQLHLRTGRRTVTRSTTETRVMNRMLKTVPKEFNMIDTTKALFVLYLKSFTSTSRPF